MFYLIATYIFLRNLMLRRGDFIGQWSRAQDEAAMLISRRRKTFRYRADNGQLLERGLQWKALKTDMLAHPDRYPPLAKGAEKMM